MQAHRAAVETHGSAVGFSENPVCHTQVHGRTAFA
jgi:hypothetical protein